MVRNVASLLCILALAAACASQPAPETTPPTASPIATVTPHPTADLGARPLMWFAPHSETRLPDFMKGSADYFDLFPPDAAWSTAAKHIQIFQTCDNLCLAREPSDDEFRTVIDGLAQRGLAFAMELGALPHPLAGGRNTECGTGIEGFGGEFSVQTLQRIKSLGGRVDFVGFGEPFAHATLFEGGDACLWSIERVATELVEFVRAVREVFPDVIFGDTEPAWNGPFVGAAEIGTWMDAYEAATGEPLGFFHLDVDWTRDGWQAVAREIEDAVRARGVPFGIIYNGGEDAASDAEWLQLTAERAYDFEQNHGGQPDHVLLQSWHFYPTRVLPETDPATFTGLINRYFGERTSLAVSQVDGSAGSAAVSGSLSAAGGAPVAGALISALAEPLEGGAQVLRLEGSVPDGAQETLIAFRINSEGAGPGLADMNIYEVNLSFDGGPNVVPNARFSQQMNGWFADGPGDARAPASDRGEGRMLRLRAAEGEVLDINTSNFEVTAGAAYELTVTASIPADSANSGYIALIFLGGDGLETRRDILPLAPAPLDIPATSTDGGGAFTLSLADLPAGRYFVRIDYDGDLDHWPSWLEHEIDVGG